MDFVSILNEFGKSLGKNCISKQHRDLICRDVAAGLFPYDEKKQIAVMKTMYKAYYDGKLIASLSEVDIDLNKI